MEFRDIESWAAGNCCEFCEGRRMHTCTLYECEPAIEKAKKYAVQILKLECKIKKEREEEKGREPKKHKLKANTNYFLNVCAGKKNFELREDNRDIKVGDYVQLQEWNPIGGYTGGVSRWLHISYVLRDKPEYGLTPGYCIFSWDN